MGGGLLGGAGSLACALSLFDGGRRQHGTLLDSSVMSACMLSQLVSLAVHVHVSFPYILGFSHVFSFISLHSFSKLSVFSFLLFRKPHVFMKCFEEARAVAERE